MVRRGLIRLDRGVLRVHARDTAFVQKVSEQMRCCFCGRDTAEERATNYVEIEITFPVFDGPMRQYFGAHVGCFDEATAVGFAIEHPPTP